MAALLSNASAETEIHRCTDADGGIVFSQLPCPPAEPVSEAADADEDKENVEDPLDNEYAAVAPQATEPVQRSDTDVAACKKKYRDAIDEIDAEIGRDYSADQADDYKRRLLALTRQLRQC